MIRNEALRNLLESNAIRQADLARGIGRSRAFVSRFVSGETGGSQATIQALLSFLGSRLGRPVTYEELFPAPAADLVAPEGRT